MAAETTKKLLESVVVFCDGACSGNPGPGGWGIVIATPEGEVRELGGRDPLTTNNQMELTAAIRALEFLRDRKGEIFIHTDSTYVIRGITQWIFGWKRKGWKNTEGKDVANRDLWEKLHTLVQGRPKNELFWRYVRGHAGIAGNDRADQIAVAFSKNEWVELFRGKLLAYSVPVHDIPESEDAIPEMKPKAAKAPPYSYLSLVGGVPYRHQTWAECERRVKGQPGAKFKKTASAQEEAELLTAWGCDPSQLKK